MADNQGETISVTLKDDQPSPSATGPPILEVVGASWNKAAILKLIQLHKEHQYLFDNPCYKKKSVWEMLVVGLQREGYDYTLVQVENKWKSLTKKYRDAVDHNAKHGQVYTRRCAFYTEISMAYNYTSQYTNQDGVESSLVDSIESNHNAVTYKNDSDKQNPVPTASQSAPHTPEPGRMKRKVEGGNLSSSSVEEGDTVSNGNALRKKKKHVHPTLDEGDDEQSDVDKILHMLHVMNEDRKKQEQLRMETLEKMHQEKMLVFKEFLTIVKSSVSQTKAKEHICRCGSSTSNIS